MAKKGLEKKISLHFNKFCGNYYVKYLPVTKE